MIKRAILIVFLFISVLEMEAQVGTDTTFLSRSGENLINHYSKIMVDHIKLYSGGYYTSYTPTGKEHPYLIEELEPGSVFYNGSLYENEEMLYNTFTDKLIINDYYNVQLIQLVSEKVKYFRLEGHTFVYIDEPSLRTGFYDLLIDGKIKLYCRRFKLFKQELTAYEVRNQFDEKNSYYIFRDGNYHLVKNKKSVRRVLSDFDKELNVFIKRNKIVFRGNFENSVSKVIEFCNAL